MSPLDDELRRTLRDRADTVVPAPDPLAGIDTRARSLNRRRRTGLAAAGALAAVGVGVLTLPPLNRGSASTDVVRLGAPTSTVTGAPTDTATAYPSPTPAADPSNLLGWRPRGSATTLSPAALQKAIAGANGSSDSSAAHYAPLYTDSTDGIPFTIGQAWMSGDTSAHTFGYAQFPTGTEVLFGTVTPLHPALVAFQLGNLPRRSTDLLVLVPAPGTGQVSYSPDATTRFRAVTPDAAEVYEVPRSRTASNDRVQVLDGDGNTDSPRYEGPVQPFLCAAKECG